jgi:hypothetical protein
MPQYTTYRFIGRTHVWRKRRVNKAILTYRKAITLTEPMSLVRALTEHRHLLDSASSLEVLRLLQSA